MSYISLQDWKFYVEWYIVCNLFSWFIFMVKTQYPMLVEKEENFVETFSNA